MPNHSAYNFLKEAVKPGNAVWRSRRGKLTQRDGRNSKEKSTVSEVVLTPLLLNGGGMKIYLYANKETNLHTGDER